MRMTVSSLEMTDLSGKRITFKRTRPNPLFQGWLEELYDEAKQKKSKLEPILHQALTSLSKYPLPLETGTECGILNGFDKRLCLFLDKRLEVYKNNLNISPEVEIQNTSASQPIPSSSNSENVQEHIVRINEISKSKKSKLKQYKPGYKTGAYAILLGLLECVEDNINTAIKKEQIIERAQKYSEESFTRPKSDTFYTAWSNITRLVKKGLVIKSSSKNATYSLSEQGKVLAKELHNDYKNRPIISDIIFDNISADNSRQIEVENGNLVNGALTETEKNDATENCNGDKVLQTLVNNDLELIEMEAGSFDIILLIDKHETSGLSNKNDPTVAQFKKYPQLNHEYRSLKVGDFTWIARHKVNKDWELVLPYVVERKRMDDLGSSIKDGRFHEQKFRLRKCGLDNVIYLVESYGSNKNVGLPVQSLMQALANTRVQDGFKVHMTDSLTNSARFLAMLTKRLTIEYEDKHLKGCSNGRQSDLLMSFEYFNRSALKTKPLTVTDTFIKLLLQLKGVSVEKALAITDIYKTPSSLIKAYESCSEKEGEFLLANLKYGEASKSVGPRVSKTLYQLFTIEEIS